ncbi:MAG: OmpA family protein [Flavobacteriales bacterium]|nr:OmpA family protein [Flavobacteriales bacterium]
MRKVLYILALLSCVSALANKSHAQSNVTIERIHDLDKVDGFMTGIHPQGIFMEVNATDLGLITDQGDVDYRAQTQFARRGDTWASFPADLEDFGFGFTGNSDLGTVCYFSDTLVVMSLMDFKVMWDEGTVVTARMMRSSVDNLMPVFVPPAGYRAIHPSISPDGSQIVFASNMPGGLGGFDLYYVNRLGGGNWSDPISLGPVINTSGNEVFPSWNGSRLCFSSDTHAGLGGFDLYYSDRSSQWKEMERFEEPINSLGDDFLLLWLSDEVALFNSDREGEDAVYRLAPVPKQAPMNELTALLECAGTPVQGAKVRIRNSLGETVINGTTGEEGKFPIDKLELNQKYRAVFEDVAPEVLRASYLYIIDAVGNRIMVFTPGGDGSFYFELLPFEDGEGLQAMDNIDESTLLNVAVEGQVYENEPGDIGKGEPIYIMDENGELMALAYTTEKGKFRFDELSPNASYTFKLDEESSALNMIIYDKGQEIVIPVIDDEAVYERVQEGEQIQLKNENGDEIVIRQDDLFVIQNIYYELNRAELNVVAKYQLDQLAEIMIKNPEIRIELGSHTDCRGEDDYNLELSERRAASALAHMKKKGIAIARMTAKGYGETVLLNGCDDGVECSEDEHALNRRTEIRIIIR